VRLETQRLSAGARDAAVSVTITDARGMVASAAAEIVVEQGSGGAFALADENSGCSARLVAGGPWSFGQGAFSLVIAALALLVCRRRGGRR
jgi:hypothetical protein